ncbi:MAG: MFS transporter [Lentisphaerae bacterium]|jgi:MFS family permease|nr:MFS transporter [Lentisphaerota bacterium]
MTFAATLTAEQRRQGRLYAYASTWCGCISEVLLDSNAIIILYISLLGGGDSFSLFSTSLTSIAYVLLMPLMSFVVDRVGLKRSTAIACWTGMTAFLIMALAPIAGAAAPHIVIGACFLYCASRPLSATAWYPLLDNFLLPRERGQFFSTMRSSYMLLNTVLIFGLGAVMGRNPPLWLIQIVLAIAGLALQGRRYFVNRFPTEFEKPPIRHKFFHSLGIAVRNSPLVGFSIYCCFLYLATSAAIPLSLIYSKSVLKVGGNVLVMMSAAGLGGTILGYSVAGRLLKRLGAKTIIIAAHISFVIVSLCFFLASPTRSYAIPLIVGATMFNGFMSGCFFVMHSTEMMALARPGNKTMAVAFCSTLSNLGTATSRLGATLIVASGMLAPTWTLGKTTITMHQTMFLMLFIMGLFFLSLLILVPAIVPEHDDYYAPN